LEGLAVWSIMVEAVAIAGWTAASWKAPVGAGS
jgi:hypothetical protein